MAKVQPLAKPLRFTIDCSAPIEDEVFDIAAFETFLNTRIKINGKTGVLGDNIAVVRDDTTVTVTSKIPFSKKALKYLTKKFLKKQQLREHLRVVAKSKEGYTVVYFNHQAGNDEEEEE